MFNLHYGLTQQLHYGREQTNIQCQCVKASLTKLGYFCGSTLNTVKQALKVGHMGEKWICDTVFSVKGNK